MNTDENDKSPLHTHSMKKTVCWNPGHTWRTHTHIPVTVPGARCGHIKPAAGAQVPATQGTTAPLDDTAWPFAALPHISMSPHQKFIRKWTRKSQETKKQYFFELPVLAAEFSKFTWLINIAFWFITTSLSFCEEHVHMIFTNYGFPFASYFATSPQNPYVISPCLLSEFVNPIENTLKPGVFTPRPREQLEKTNVYPVASVVASAVCPFW